MAAGGGGAFPFAGTAEESALPSMKLLLLFTVPPAPLAERVDTRDRVLSVLSAFPMVDKDREVGWFLRGSSYINSCGGVGGTT